MDKTPIVKKRYKAKSASAIPVIPATVTLAHLATAVSATPTVNLMQSVVKMTAKVIQSVNVSKVIKRIPTTLAFLTYSSATKELVQNTPRASMTKAKASIIATATMAIEAME